MRKLLLGCVVVAVSVLVLAGCEKTAELTEPPWSDESEIGQIISEMIWFKTTGYYGQEDTTTTVAGPIIPLHWWRELEGNPPFNLEIQINSERDSASVTVTLDISGTLHIIALVDTVVMIDKPLNDNPIRHAIFLKDTVESYHHGWRLYKISGVEVTSDVVTVAIDSVRIRRSSYPDMAITDPQVLLLLDEVVTFAQGEGVSLSVYTDDETAEVYFHSWGQTNWLRSKFEHQGGGVYSGGWLIPGQVGIYHLAFDMLQHETLWDSAYSYDSKVWLLPYKVE